MTELDDELASAYLDDALTAEERARVEGDAGLRARVAELRHARDTLAAAPVDAPSEAARDAAIRAAVESSNVIDLATRRRRQLRIASIAAAVLLVLGAAGIVIRSAGDSSPKQFATVGGSIASSSSASAAAERSATAAAGAASPLFTTSGQPGLGSFADRSALVAAVQATLSSASTTTAATASDATSKPAKADSTRCAATAPGSTINEVFSGTAVLAGTAVQLDVFSLDDGSRRLVVTDSSSCTELFTQPL